MFCFTDCIHMQPMDYIGVTAWMNTTYFSFANCELNATYMVCQPLLLLHNTHNQRYFLCTTPRKPYHFPHKQAKDPYSTPQFDKNDLISSLTVTNSHPAD